MNTYLSEITKLPTDRDTTKLPTEITKLPTEITKLPTQNSPSEITKLPTDRDTTKLPTEITKLPTEEYLPLSRGISKPIYEQGVILEEDKDKDKEDYSTKCRKEVDRVVQGLKDFLAGEKVNKDTCRKVVPLVLKKFASVEEYCEFGTFIKQPRYMSEDVLVWFKNYYRSFAEDLKKRGRKEKPISLVIYKLEVNLGIREPTKPELSPQQKWELEVRRTIENGEREYNGLLSQSTIREHEREYRESSMDFSIPMGVP